MDTPVKISLDNLLPNSKNFNFLRQEGIKHVQQIASATWSDHNLHDPGITLLEALCYALTEAGLQAGATSDKESKDDVNAYVANLLTSGEQASPQDFFTCSQVLPSSPVSLTDFQKVLLDHPSTKRAWVSVINGAPFGRLSVLQQFKNLITSPVPANNDLNSNIVRTDVTVSATQYEIEIAFPYWDDPEAAPFQNDVTITNLVFNPNVVNPWKPISGTDSYFTFLDFLCNTNPISWPLVLRIVSSLSGISATTKDDILTASAVSLITPSTNPTLLKQYNERVMMAFQSSHRIRSYIKNYRNLCETFSAYRSVRIQEVGISAIIEMGAGADIESLLANIFYTIYLYISPQLNPQPLSALQSKLRTEIIFEGPLLRHGFIQDSLLRSNLPANTLYVSDIMRLIMQMGTGTDIQTREHEQNRPVISVTNVTLSLYLDNRSITTSARDCLQLINSSRHIAQLSLEKCNITVTRNNTVATYDLSKVIVLYNELINVGNLSNIIPADTPTDIPIPVGESLPIGDYYSIQNDLPVTYGVGKTGPPIAATAQRFGQAKQLQGYLFFFEQVLAGYFAQLAHVNALFSANATAATTLYQLPLYDVPAASDLLLPLEPFYPTWDAFVNDADNPYRQVLKKGPETEDQFLVRRHQMLDHLLSRMGEDMQSFSSLIFRQKYSDPNSLPSSASTALLQLKADYYYALPDLEKNRAQAFGHPAWRNNRLITISSAPGTSLWSWQILDESGNIIFLQSVLEPNKTSAEETAEAAMVLATSVANYTTETDSGGLQRIALRWANGQPSVAISNQTYATVIDAQNDFPIVQQLILSLWMRYSLSSLEARLYHLLGISMKGERRTLINPISDYFDILDAAVPPPFNKEFKLRSTTNPASPVLLESQIPYIDPVENTAISLATGGVLNTIKYGIYPGNFSSEFNLVSLHDPSISSIPSANIIAQSPVSFASAEDAQAAITQIRELLYRYYSNEGFYIIEHILLYPVTTGDTPITFPDIESTCLPVSSTGIRYSLPDDPYSFILTMVFPSGYSRDFSDTSATPLKSDAQPDRFRGREFRQYTEETIRKFCPAHILPIVMWTDTALAGTPLMDGLSQLYPCFDNLESTYTAWLSAYFTDDVDPTVIAPLRNSLVSVLNGMFSDKN
jgi:hypothetical protein